MKNKHKLLVTLFLLIQASTAFAAGTQTGGFAANPAFPNKVNPGQFTLEIKPGTSATESIKIVNNDNLESIFYIDGVDSETTAEGKIGYKTSEEPQKGAGTWVKFDQNPITLAPKSQQTYQFTISVPADTKEGNYTAGIEVLSKGTRTSEIEKGMMVNVNVRYVDKINIKVTNNPQPIEKMPLPPAPPLLTPVQIYLLISVLLFVGIIVYFVFSNIKAKKKRHAAATHHSSEHHPHHSEKSEK